MPWTAISGGTSARIFAPWGGCVFTGSLLLVNNVFGDGPFVGQLRKFQIAVYKYIVKNARKKKTILKASVVLRELWLIISIFKENVFMVRSVGGPPPQPPEFSKAGDSRNAEWIAQLNQAKILLGSSQVAGNPQKAMDIINSVYLDMKKHSSWSGESFKQALAAVTYAWSDVHNGVMSADAIDKINQAIHYLQFVR